LQTVFNNFRSLSQVGDIRGKDAMLALEFVTDPVTRNPLDVAHMYNLIKKIYQWGVLVHLSGHNILIIPPVNLPRDYVKKSHNAIAFSIMEVLNTQV
jgi:adenosylmethionine-8-amino-7-oxononanoate aminotransferase